MSLRAERHIIKKRNPLRCSRFRFFVLEWPAGEGRRVRSKRGAPGVLLEAHQHLRLAHKDRALDQHPVRGQKGKLLLLAHGREPVLQIQRLVLQPAGVEEFPQRQSAALAPRRQFPGRGPLVLDVADLLRNAVVVQPFPRLPAGGAFRVTNKQHIVLLHSRKQYSIPGRDRKGIPSPDLLVRSQTLYPAMGLLRNPIVVLLQTAETIDNTRFPVIC